MRLWTYQHPAIQFYEAYQSIEWEFDAKGKLLVKLTKK